MKESSQMEFWWNLSLYPDKCKIIYSNFKCQTQKKYLFEEEIKICPEYIQNKTYVQYKKIQTLCIEYIDILCAFYLSNTDMSIIGQMEQHKEAYYALPAPKYIDYLMTWVQDQLEDVRHYYFHQKLV